MTTPRFPEALTAAQMREADRRCIEELGIPGAVLMNNAGAAVYHALPAGSIGIVCGKGNNGGDGYVVARLALLDGRAVQVVLLTEIKSITGDARIFLDAYRRLGGTVRVATSEAAAAEAVAALADCDVLVDAMLGTGVSGEVRGPIRAAIDAWPGAPTTIAVDLPSGLDADAGSPCGACVRAHTTLTLQYPKAGFNTPGASTWTGAVVVADIGIPSICAHDAAWAEHAAKHLSR